MNMNAENETAADRRRGAGSAACRLHHGQDAGQADRDQPERRHPAGSAGSAAAGRAAADQAEPARLPADAAEASDEALARALRDRCIRRGHSGRGALAGIRRARRRAPCRTGRRALRRLSGHARRPSSPTVQRQVSAINIRRRSLYVDLAKRRGVTPQVAGIAAGCELLARVAVGEAYMLQDGVWRRRAGRTGHRAAELLRLII